MIVNRVGVILGLDDHKLDLLTEAAYFHDIGKTKINKKILEKVEPLTDEEFEEMKRHTEYSRDIFNKDNSERLRRVEIVSMMHHEFKKNKERNYPRVEGRHKLFEDIGRVLSIVDTVQAIVDSNRSYNSKGKFINSSMAINIAKEELDLDGYEYILENVILAMKESGKYFKNELGDIDMTNYYLKYKGVDYFSFLGKNN